MRIDMSQNIRCSLRRFRRLGDAQKLLRQLVRGEYQFVMAGEGPPSTTMAMRRRQAVDADPGLRSGQALRRHDDGIGRAHCQVIRLFLGVA